MAAESSTPDPDTEIATLRAVVAKLVIEPVDTAGHAWTCAAWLEATPAEHAAVQRALDAHPVDGHAGAGRG